ncbi:MAG TPA: methyltransferase domain-containing protein [Candidatus Hydrogenedentes bacterium]|nr:methyltransferase domain-containing protein [Candidatus Hydrogenedentota bacterium]HQH52003.1 methyltransferase domain-containing protein [Candidatus Hydrogenedentota bacterium]
MEEMNRRIEAFFDNLAPTWDEAVASRFADRLAAMVDALGIAAGESVLDVGAGTGILARQLVGRVAPNGQVVAVDLSRAMLREGKSLRPDAPVAWIQADVLDPPFARGVFDWVICYSVFPHFLDQQHAMTELAGLLKPRGKLAVLHSQSREAINEHHEKVGDVVGGHTLPGDAGMTILFRNAGLELLRLENREDGFVALAQFRGHNT